MRIAVKRLQKTFIASATLAGLLAFALTSTAFAQGGFGGGGSSVPLSKVEAKALASAPIAKDIPKVEQLLERAMAINPKVVAARAELQQAQANLNRVQLGVAQDIIDLRAKWEIIRRKVEHLEAGVQAAPDATSDMRAQAYIAARAELSQIERKLPLLTGFMGMYGQVKGSVGPATATKPAIKAPKELDLPVEPVTLDFEKQTMEEVALYLAEFTGYQFILDPESGVGDMPVTLSLKAVPLKDALQAIEDTNWPVRFVARPYGILVTDDDKAKKLGRKTTASQPWWSGDSPRGKTTTSRLRPVKPPKPAPPRPPSVKAAETPEKGAKIPDIDPFK